MGLVININKTKYMLATPEISREVNLHRNLKIESDEIESVNEFVNLGP